MRFSILILISGILLLSACGEESGDPTFSFSRAVTPDARSNDEWNADTLFAYEPDFAVHLELAAGDGRACAFGKRNGFQSEGYISCWGRRMDGSTKYPVGHSTKITSDTFKNVLSIGEDHVCATLTTADRRVHCGGSNSNGQNTDPEPILKNEAKAGHWLTDPNLVVSGDAHNCALDFYGTYCWGDNGKGQTDVPVMQDVQWVAAGGDTSCAIDGNDGLFCWGDNTEGQTEIPDFISSVSKVAVGADFVCAANGGQIDCWGNTEDWSEQPGVYTNVAHISAGQHHVCVLDDTGAVAQPLHASCFGKESSANLLDVPDDINSNIRTIAAGNGFTCASNMYSGYAWSPDEDALGNDIVDDMTGEPVYSQEDHKGILCWGKNDEGQASAPKQLCLGYNNQAIDYDERTCPEY